MKNLRPKRTKPLMKFQQKLDLKSKYGKLENAAEDKWKDAKKVFSSAYDSFNEGFNKLKSLFSLSNKQGWFLCIPSLNF